VKTFQQLSNKLGKERVLWRYDPIIINDEFTVPFHMDRFKILCHELKGYTDICTISFVDLYNKLSKRVKEEVIQAITPEQMHYMAATFSEIGREYGIEVRACSETIDLSSDGVKPATCISKVTIEQVCGHYVAAKKDKSQRPECGCIQSVDIGVYNTCKNGCIYCYANHSENSINNNWMKHNPYADILIGTVDKNEKIITRKY
jgi:sulfatase maturation enzyme AslB (radical SAM superfamily)